MENLTKDKALQQFFDRTHHKEPKPLQYDIRNQVSLEDLRSIKGGSPYVIKGVGLDRDIEEGDVMKLVNVEHNKFIHVKVVGYYDLLDSALVRIIHNPDNKSIARKILNFLGGKK